MHLVMSTLEELSCDFNFSRVSHVLIDRGKAFHKTRLAFEKDRSPTVTYLAFGMTRKCLFDDLKLLPGVYGLINSNRYNGASP